MGKYGILDFNATRDLEDIDDMISFVELIASC